MPDQPTEQTPEWVGDAYAELVKRNYIEPRGMMYEQYAKQILTIAYRQSNEFKQLIVAKGQTEYLLERIRWALGESSEDTRPEKP